MFSWTTTLAKLSQKNLTLCRKQVRAVGGSTLKCSGWISVVFRIGRHSTIQPLYICEQVDRIYLSRKVCTELNILPDTFPFPMDQSSNIFSVLDQTNVSSHPVQTSAGPKPPSLPTLPSQPLPTPTTPQPPPCPKKIPFAPIKENIPKLKKYLLDQFACTTFNRDGPFPQMVT